MDHIIGQRIKALRLSKGLSQTDLADALHISQPTLQRIEQGESSVWAKYLNDICTYFEVRPEEIVTAQEQNVQLNYDNASGVSAHNNSGVTAHIYHNVSDKLIQQYELRIAEKDQLIADLKARIEKLEGGSL